LEGFRATTPRFNAGSPSGWDGWFTAALLFRVKAVLAQRPPYAKFSTRPIKSIRVGINADDHGETANGTQTLKRGGKELVLALRMRN
jgi:hypothetical protein